MNRKIKQLNRKRRQARGRAKISGSASRPRIAVYKSNKYVFIQAIDDTIRKTLASASDKGSAVKKVDAGKDGKDTGLKEKKAFSAGERVGEILKKMDIKAGVFDRGGFAYHGRIKAVAEGLRKAGIKI